MDRTFHSFLLGAEVAIIAVLQPVLAWLFAEAMPATGFDMTGITNLGATAVVSMLLIWVVTKDRPKERDAFLAQLQQSHKDGYEAMEHQRQQYVAEMQTVREEFKKDRDADREARKDVLNRVHEIVSVIKEPK